MEGRRLTKVAFCVPTRDKPHPAFVIALEASLPALEEAGIEHCLVAETGNPYISGARATMLRKALNIAPDCVVFLDDDLSWRPQDLVNLIKTDVDVCAGLYRFKQPEIKYMGVLETDEEGYPKGRLSDGLLSAIRVPAGFLKITAAGVEKFMLGYPELCYGPAYARCVDLFNHGAHNGQWWGEDYSFSRRWVELGHKLWVMPDADLIHWGKPCNAHEGNFHKFLLAQK